MAMFLLITALLCSTSFGSPLHGIDAGAGASKDHNIDPRADVRGLPSPLPTARAILDRDPQSSLPSPPSTTTTNSDGLPIIIPIPVLPLPPVAPAPIPAPVVPVPDPGPPTRPPEPTTTTSICSTNIATVTTVSCSTTFVGSLSTYGEQCTTTSSITTGCSASASAMTTTLPGHPPLPTGYPEADMMWVGDELQDSPPNDSFGDDPPQPPPPSPPPSSPNPSPSPPPKSKCPAMTEIQLYHDDECTDPFAYTICVSLGTCHNSQPVGWESMKIVNGATPGIITAYTKNDCGCPTCGSHGYSATDTGCLKEFRYSSGQAFTANAVGLF